mmetsp:Transcript_2667/g.10210  ORF Transcript_2667/g.10210 Transcript_2667/m.10210 type:complete len:200 (+) Transcript_2667:237-836(+)
MRNAWERHAAYSVSLHARNPTGLSWWSSCELCESLVRFAVVPLQAAGFTPPPSFTSNSLALPSEPTDDVPTCPFACTVKAGTTMSIAGPALACAIGTAPEAMYSTTQIPKCSSTMACNPKCAPMRSLRSVLKGTSTWKSTEFSMPSSTQSSRSPFNLRSSATPRHPPTNFNRASAMAWSSPPFKALSPPPFFISAHARS